MAELLARHATPQTEAALLQVARGKTVQAMRIALSPQGSPDPTRRRRARAHPLAHAPRRRSMGARGHAHDGRAHGRQVHRRPLPRITPRRGHHPPPRAQPPAQAVQTDEADVSAQMEAEHTAWRAQMQRLQHQQAEAELQSRPAVPPAPTRARPPTPTTCPSASKPSTHASVTTAQSSPVAISSSAAWRNASWPFAAGSPRLRQRSTLRPRTPRHVARLPPQQSQPRPPQPGPRPSHRRPPTRPHRLRSRPTHRPHRHPQHRTRLAHPRHPPHLQTPPRRGPSRRNATRFTAQTDRSPPSEAQSNKCRPWSAPS